MGASVIEVAQAFYLDEINDHLTYQALADAEGDPKLKKLLAGIAAIESKHAAFWRGMIESRGGAVPARRASRWRLGLLRALQRAVDPVLLVSALELGESSAVRKYFEYLRSAPLDDEERQRLRGIIVDELEHEVRFRTESEKLGVSNIRDFVLGMNDGLVEILGAVTGLSAVYAHNPLIVAISGLVVGIAGALSMGLGAFVSVRSQRQVNDGRAERMEILFEVAPERAVDEYRSTLVASGVPRDAAAKIARQVGANREAITQLVIPETGEREVRSGLFTGLAYLLGVVFPVSPYLLAGNALHALVGSVLLAGLALAVTAAVISILSGISLKKKVLEMVVAGFAAAGIAYLFGAAVQRLFGIEV
ncbi:MAG: rubrerythrin family protein [Gammaproteobacteria bacterium]|nr:rubrerythrin family protein [Gammaproteobacteria bacterium]